MWRTNERSLFLESHFNFVLADDDDKYKKRDVARILISRAWVWLISNYCIYQAILYLACVALRSIFVRLRRDLGWLVIAVIRCKCLRVTYHFLCRILRHTSHFLLERNDYASQEQRNSQCTTRCPSFERPSLSRERERDDSYHCPMR